MINWVIGIVIFSLAGWMLFKTIQRSKQGKCPSCASGCTCDGEDCKCQ